jgi:hypothetical protein
VGEQAAEPGHPLVPVETNGEGPDEGGHERPQGSVRESRPVVGDVASEREELGVIAREQEGARVGKGIRETGAGSIVEKPQLLEQPPREHGVGDVVGDRSVVAGKERAT